MKYGGPSGGSQQSGGKRFFAKYDGPSSGSLLSGGGNIILRIIRLHFLAASVDLAVKPLHVQYSSDGSRPLTTLTTRRQEHQRGGRRRGVGRGRHGAGEDAAVDAHAERSTMVHWFGCAAVTAE